MRHPELLEDVLFDVLFKRNSRNNLDQITSKRHPEVGVDYLFSRKACYARLAPGEIISERDEFLRSRNRVTNQTFVNATRMRQQVSDRHRRWIGINDLKSFEVGVDIGVQIYFPALDELHDGRGGDEFRDRGRAEDCFIREDSFVAPIIRITVSFLK